LCVAWLAAKIEESLFSAAPPLRGAYAATSRYTSLPHHRCTRPQPSGRCCPPFPPPRAPRRAGLEKRTGLVSCAPINSPTGSTGAKKPVSWRSLGRCPGRRCCCWAAFLSRRGGGVLTGRAVAGAGGCEALELTPAALLTLLRGVENVISACGLWKARASVCACALKGGRRAVWCCGHGERRRAK